MNHFEFLPPPELCPLICAHNFDIAARIHVQCGCGEVNASTMNMLLAATVNTSRGSYNAAPTQLTIDCSPTLFGHFEPDDPAST